MSITNPEPERIRHGHIAQACTRHNDAKMLDYPMIGYLMYADIKGDGHSRRRVYQIVNANGGVTYSPLNGRTLRETYRNILGSIQP